MKLKVDYRRPTGGRTDIAITTDASATVSDLAAELLATDPRQPSAPAGPVTLATAPPGQEDFRQLEPDRTIGESPIASGWSLRVEPRVPQGPAAQRSLVELSVTTGPNAGRPLSLSAGSYVIGRHPGCDIVLDDDLVSRRHARLEVGSVVEIVDLKSANGVEVDGGRISRLVITSPMRVQLGDTELTITPLASAQPVTAGHLGAGAPFNRSPRVEARYPGNEHPSPDVPTETDKPPFPWMLMVVPILMGAVSYVVSNGNPSSFVFVAMSPLMMVANYVMGRKRSARQRDTQISTFEEQIRQLGEALSREVESERAARLAEAPSTAEVDEAVRRASQLMWTRRPEHWSFLQVRVGLGAAPSRNRVAARIGMARGIPRYAQLLDDLVEQHRLVAGVPIVENPVECGALGVVGPAALAAGVARAALMQWAGLHSPAELVIAAMVGPGDGQDFDWLKWLPHTSSPSSPVDGPHLVDSPTSTTALLAQLEDLVATRLGSANTAAARPPMSGTPAALEAGGRVGDATPVEVPVPAVVVLVTASAPVSRARLVQMAESAADAGVVVLFVAERVGELPAVCRTFVDASAGPAGGSVHFVRHGTSIAPVELETATAAEAARFAVAMSPYFDASAVVEDTSGLPSSVPLLRLLGADAAGSAAAVVDRWRETESLVTIPPQPREKASGLRARVGSLGVTDMALDLRVQGPHALVGGTSGSGKSEFLQAWVLGMAAEYSPQRVTFLFVDYKGGAAFAECDKLPHRVGLVTDLSPHLVTRALTSLGAEIQHRERLLARKGVANLLELERRGDPECPPALVIVIDEFAALHDDVPEFVDGVVDIAQRGRSLGIHLIMATQQPSGVIKDNLRANTNLRIALRMADEADSQDVLGSPVAATFDPATPGRAAAKTGPGRLVTFQSAFAGGRSDMAVPKPAISITELRFGAEQPWTRPPAPPTTTTTVVDPGPTDLVQLVNTIIAAATNAGLPEPRRPWLDELRTTYDLANLGPRTDAELLLGTADDPKQQAQRLVSFRPDVDGHMVVYGTGGSGKTTLLRTLAMGAGVTPRGGPVRVYCLDFAAGGLRMLEPLPHVGAVISGDDEDKVTRLFRTLKAELERRTREYPAQVDSIAAYRSSTGGRPDEPRILVLLDGFFSFRDGYEAFAARSGAYATFLQILSEGRRVGIHVVLTGDKPGVPGAVTSSGPRRVVLRMADDTMYAALNVPKGFLSANSVPGRGVIDGLEVQIASPGGSASTFEQARAIEELAEALRDSGLPPAPPIASLEPRYPIDAMPREVGGEPVLGIADLTLAPIGFSVEGPLVVAGPPGSGRSNALAALTQAVAQWRPELSRYYIGVRPSELEARGDWTEAALGPARIATLARELAGDLDYVGPNNPPVLIVVEAAADLLGTDADAPMVELAKQARRMGHLLIAENETSGWTGGWSAALLNEIKAARRGVLLQPDQPDGESLLRTALPRIVRNEFPEGRAFYVHRGRVVKVQLPMMNR